MGGKKKIRFCSPQKKEGRHLLVTEPGRLRRRFKKGGCFGKRLRIHNELGDVFLESSAGKKKEKKEIQVLPVGGIRSWTYGKS